MTIVNQISDMKYDKRIENISKDMVEQQYDSIISAYFYARLYEISNKKLAKCVASCAFCH